MINICPKCEQYSLDKSFITRDDSLHVVCKNCKHSHPFKRLPIFFILGESGTGKSTIALELQKQSLGFFVFEQDILWRNEIKNFDQNKQCEDIRLMLRIAKNITQANILPLLTGSFTPNHVLISPELIFFSKAVFIILTVSEKDKRERLSARAIWRGYDINEDPFDRAKFVNITIEPLNHIQYSLHVIDTSEISTNDSIDKILKLMKEQI